MTLVWDFKATVWWGWSRLPPYGETLKLASSYPTIKGFCLFFNSLLKKLSATITVRKMRSSLRLRGILLSCSSDFLFFYFFCQFHESRLVAFLKANILPWLFQINLLCFTVNYFIKFMMLTCIKACVLNHFLGVRSVQSGAADAPGSGAQVPLSVGQMMRRGKLQGDKITDWNPVYSK